MVHQNGNTMIPIQVRVDGKPICAYEGHSVPRQSEMIEINGEFYAVDTIKYQIEQGDRRSSGFKQILTVLNVRKLL